MNRALIAMPDGTLDDILNPSKLMGFMEMAATLSKVCRWGGRCDRFYSVLQHSVEVARRLPDVLKIQGLLHDFSEAWIGDIPAPLKHTPMMAFIREAEDALQRRIWTKYGGFSELDPLVHEIDTRIAVDEALSLGLGHSLIDPSKALGVRVEPLLPDDALALFIEYAEPFFPAEIHATTEANP